MGAVSGSVALEGADDTDRDTNANQARRSSSLYASNETKSGRDELVHLGIMSRAS